MSLTKKAYQKLKDMIVRYQLKPGVNITSKELANALGMSQTPIREALCILEHQRLIVRNYNKGYSVRSLSIGEIIDLYDMRIAVEVLAVERLSGNMTQSQLDDLSKILEELQLFIINSDKNKILEFEQKIHTSILEATCSELIIEIGQNILDRIWMLQKIVLFTSEHWEESQHQHLEIVKNLVGGDPEISAGLMKNHLRWGKKLIVERLNDKDDFIASVFTGASEIYLLDQRQKKEQGAG